VISAFGCTSHLMARTIGDVLDLPAAALMRMDSSTQALLIQGEEPFFARRLNYLRDKMFTGRFDPNPRYALVNSHDHYEENGKQTH
jgi:type IV secretory pathway TraG/TraD family ATPase VirD4